MEIFLLLPLNKKINFFSYFFSRMVWSGVRDETFYPYATFSLRCATGARAKSQPGDMLGCIFAAAALVLCHPSAMPGRNFFFFYKRCARPPVVVYIWNPSATPYGASNVITYN